jgi:hypothetical protein
MSGSEPSKEQFYRRELAKLREYLRERLGNDYARLIEDIERRVPDNTDGMSGTRVLFCGGRKYNDDTTVNRVASKLYGQHGRKLMFIEGGAQGADRLISDWADHHGLPHARVRALWEIQGNSAGRIRNEAQLLLSPHKVVAFPGGRGTRDMVTRAREAGINVEEIS